MSQETKLRISQINRTGGTQPRANLDEETVRDYAALIKDGVAFPPIDVMYDGTNYWPWNGFHRIAAHELAQLTEVPARMTTGTLEDAQWASFSANKDQGLRRGGGDVKRILMRIFEHPAWQKKSQREIAAHVGCSRGTVFEFLEQYRNKTNQDGPRAARTPRKSEPATPAASTVARARAGEDDGFDSPDEGSSLPGTAPAPAAQPAHPGAMPWEAFNVEFRDKVVGSLRQAYRELARITAYDTETKRMKCQFARGFSTANSLGVITALVRALENCLPAESSDEYPGYLTKSRVNVRDGAAKKSA